MAASAPDAVGGPREGTGPKRVAMALYGDLTYDSRVQREAMALAQAGFDVEVFCLAGDLPRTFENPRGLKVTTVVPSISATLPGSGGPLIQTDHVSRVRRVTATLGWLTAYIRNLRSWGRQVVDAAGEVDVWHVHDLTGLVAVVPRLGARPKVVYDSHEIFVETGSASHLPRSARRLLRMYERRLVSRADALVTVNHGLAEHLGDRLRPRRTVIVRNCPPKWTPHRRASNLLRDAAGVPAQRDIALYHGRFSPNRGIEEAAAALLAPGLESLHLVLLGYGDHRDELLGLANDQQFGGRIHVLDAVPPDQLQAWVHGADVGVVVLTHSSMNHWYASPNKLWECISAGVPVIASDFPVMRDIVMGDPNGSLGAVCDPEDVGDLVRAFKKLLGRPARDRAAQRARCLHAAHERLNWQAESEDSRGSLSGSDGSGLTMSAASPGTGQRTLPQRGTVWLTGAVVVAGFLAGMLAIGMGLSGPSLAAGFGVGAAFLIVTVRYPGVLLAAYLLVPFYKAAIEPYSPIDITFILAILCIFQIIPLLTAGSAARVSRAVLVLWVALAVLVLGGVLYAPDQQLALVQSVTFYALVLVPLLPAALRVGLEERHLRHFVWAFLCMGVITVGAGLLTGTDGQRLTALDTNTIQTSRSALMVPLLAMMLVPRTRSTLVRLALIGIGLLALPVALASGTRGPLVALGVIGLFAAVRYFSRPGAINARLILASAVLVTLPTLVLASGAVTISGEASSRIEGLAATFEQVLFGGDQYASGVEGQSRLLLWGAAIEMFQAHPIAGVGTAGFEALSPEVLWPEPGDAWPHNALLEIAANYGIPGLLVFLSLVTLALTRPLPTGSYGHVVRVLFVFFLINAMFSVSIRDDRMLWGLILLLATMNPRPAPGAFYHDVQLPAPGPLYSSTELGPSMEPVPPNYWTRKLQAAGWAWPVLESRSQERVGPYVTPANARERAGPSS